MKRSLPVIAFLVFLILIPVTYAETTEMTADEHYLMGNAFSSLGQGQYENATKEYRMALAIRPDFTDALNNLGIVLNRQGKYEEALAVADEAIRISRDDAEAWYNRGCTLGMLKRYEEETDSYKQALTIRPNFTSAWENMGASYFDQGRFEDAIAAYLNETTYDPENAISWYYLGTVYEKTGQNSAAIAAFENAVKIQPNFTTVQNRLDSVKRNLTSTTPSPGNNSSNVAEQDSSGLLSGIMNILK